MAGSATQPLFAGDGGEGQAVVACACGTDVPKELLACPVCRRLVHAEALQGWVAAADRHEATGELRDALSQLRNALQHLPPASSQHAVVHERVRRLSDRIDAGDVPATQRDAASSDGPDTTRTKLVGLGSAVAGAGLLVWKFKFVFAFIATKGKLLLVGLSKSTTLFTMLMSLGLYWTLWGWRFALGLVLSIYVHEMGHVATLRHFGIRATAPMFLPGLGAMVRMQQYPQTEREDARVGLAGPIWGLGAALLALAAFALTGNALLAAIARVGAWINLFNLLPFWQLDGGRGFRAMSRGERWIAVGVIAGMGVITGEGLLVLLGLAAVVRALSGEAPAGGDRRTLLTYAGLVVVLSLLAVLPVPTPI